ncbi:hypothetical protein ACIGXM_15685 [Kitasatospora sp. NPDC052896]|uniref:hypothetical protein n=1 Tax=Kitasatospora sp. NPDC052896 TaxID=3364061 RepID=UPI0037C62712
MARLRAVPRPRTREGAAAVVAVAAAVLELVVLSTVPVRERPVVGGALVGAAASVLGVLGLIRHRLRSPRQPVPRAERAAERVTDGPWFTARTLEGFPVEAVRPLLHGPQAPSLNALYTAWVFVIQGYDTRWIARQLYLPTELVRLLADTARGPEPAGRPPRSAGAGPPSRPDLSPPGGCHDPDQAAGPGASGGGAAARAVRRGTR